MKFPLSSITTLGLFTVSSSAYAMRTYDAPEYEQEKSVFEILEDLCNKDTEALVKCYKDDADAVKACASCAWEPLHREGLTYGAACDGIKEVVEEDYDRCVDCKSECVNEVHLLEGCGIGLFCDEVPNIKLA